MKLLLDTHAFIWWDSEPDKLSEGFALVSKDRVFEKYPVKVVW